VVASLATAGFPSGLHGAAGSAPYRHIAETSDSVRAPVSPVAPSPGSFVQLAPAPPITHIKSVVQFDLSPRVESGRARVAESGRSADCALPRCGPLPVKDPAEPSGTASPPKLSDTALAASPGIAVTPGPAPSPASDLLPCQRQSPAEASPSAEPESKTAEPSAATSESSLQSGGTPPTPTPTTSPSPDNIEAGGTPPDTKGSSVPEASTQASPKEYPGAPEYPSPYRTSGPSGP
jgi:hypothetical protein